MSENSKVPKIEPEYLGDGVYATFDGYHIELRLGSHEAKAVAYLDPVVVARLQSFVQKIKDAV